MGIEVHFQFKGKHSLGGSNKFIENKKRDYLHHSVKQLVKMLSLSKKNILDVCMCAAVGPRARGVLVSPLRI